MEEQHPRRLLRTYSGLRGRQGRGGGGGRPLGLRVLPPPVPWISPPVDPKCFFNTSSSGAGTSFEDPPYLPSKKKRAQKQPKRKGGKKKKKTPKGAKENQAPLRDSEPDSCLPPTPLCKNVTHRRCRFYSPPSLRKETGVGLEGPTPLLCSTPELPLLTPAGVGKDLVKGKEDSPISCLFGDRRSRRQLREHSCGTDHDALELILLTMDQEDEHTEGGCLEYFDQRDLGSPRRKFSLGEDPQKEPPSTLESLSCLSRSPCTPSQSRSVTQPHNIWRKEKASSRHLEDSAASPVQGTDSDQKFPASSKTNTSPSRGAFQLQARIYDGKLALSLPKVETLHATKRQQVSVELAVTPVKKALVGLNGALSEELTNDWIDRNSPWLQPVVLLDNQVVPNWLATQSKQATDRHSQKTECILPLKSPCNLPTISDTRGNNQVVPICGVGTTGRKACISGFSSTRWGQRRKPERLRCKKNLERKYQAETSHLQESLRNRVEDDLAFSFLSPDSSFKNSALWRRIRASFSLHKKKKILSESESLNSSVIASGSVGPHITETPKTPFTQKLGYSICPSSSMVLLSSMESFSMSKVMLTDAEKVYRECQQKGPITFEECIPPKKMQQCEKIGEGVFGEVFKTEGERGAVALKIIPIEGSERVNGEPQKTFSEILPEIIISKELSLLAEEEVNQTSGFIQLYSVHCVQGAYPEPLLNAWDEYNRLRISENDRPDFFRDQQLFMVLEFEDGGTDLENMQNRQLSSIFTAKSILHQITASLAVAEEALRFEHRDLHWGNVLVRQTDLKEVSVTLKGETYVFPTHGILVNIIDYTFSRLERDGLTVYCDLSTDEEVFQGRGDYQFDIYRRMREENLNNWADYFPHSNILWLHYLVDKLLKEVSYKKKSTTPSLKQVQKGLKHFSEDLLGFSSAADLLSRSTFFQ